MRRRRRPTSRKPPTAKQPIKVKRGGASRAARNRRLSALDKGIEVEQLARERDDAVGQLSAASEVLTIISSSVGDLEPVFEALLRNAIRLCEAKFGDISRFDSKAFHFAARDDTPTALAEFQKRRGPFLPIVGGGLDRMMRTKEVIQTADNAAASIPTRQRG